MCYNIVFQLFQSIVLPLLILVKGMQKQNEYLCDVLRKKDMEITEYKLDGAVLSRSMFFFIDLNYF